MSTGAAKGFAKLSKAVKNSRKSGKVKKITDDIVKDVSGKYGMGPQKFLDSAKDVIAKIGGKKFTKILRTPKGSRPLPETYLPKGHIDAHLAKFDDGASYLVPKDVLIRECRKLGLGKIKKRKTSKRRIARERSARRGYMLQMDGSYHKWFGKSKSCLISLIDDAITEEIILENLNHFTRHDIKIDTFQIDDGYQNAVGDWLVIDQIGETPPMEDVLIPPEGSQEEEEELSVE